MKQLRYSERTGTNIIKILVIGNVYSGKRTFVRRSTGKEVYQCIMHPIYSDYESTRITIDGNEIELQFWKNINDLNSSKKLVYLASPKFPHGKVKISSSKLHGIIHDITRSFPSKSR